MFQSLSLDVLYSEKFILKTDKDLLNLIREDKIMVLMSTNDQREN